MYKTQDFTRDSKALSTVDIFLNIEYNQNMLTNLLAISELAVKVVAGVSGVLIAIVIVIILIFHKKDED